MLSILTIIALQREHKYFTSKMVSESKKSQNATNSVNIKTFVRAVNQTRDRTTVLCVTSIDRTKP